MFTVSADAEEILYKLILYNCLEVRHLKYARKTYRDKSSLLKITSLKLSTLKLFIYLLLPFPLLCKGRKKCLKFAFKFSLGISAFQLGVTSQLDEHSVMKRETIH